MQVGLLSGGEGRKGRGRGEGKEGGCHLISSLQAHCYPKPPGVEESYSSRSSAVSQVPDVFYGDF